MSLIFAKRDLFSKCGDLRLTPTPKVFNMGGLLKGFLRSPRLFGFGLTLRAIDPPSLLVAGSQKTGSPAPHAGEPILFGG